MCQPTDYPKNCANCAGAGQRATEGDCPECIEIEFETKKPFTKWRPKEQQPEESLDH